MRTNWLVAANATQARVLQQTDEAGVFEPVADLKSHLGNRSRELLARRIAAAS
jgi:hypothetical protein